MSIVDRDIWTRKEIAFTALVEMAQLKESEQSLERFRRELDILSERELLDMGGAFEKEGCEDEHFNIATLCVIFNRMSYFDMIVEKTPSLLWQRSMREYDRNNGGLVPLTTPLDAAVTSRNLPLLKQILENDALVAYSYTKPIDYAALIDRCYALCDTKEVTLHEYLLKVASSTLLTKVSTEILKKASKRLYKHALPFEAYDGAPDHVAHMDFMLRINASEGFRRGHRLEVVAGVLERKAREFISFLKNPHLYTGEKFADLQKEIPDFFPYVDELFSLGVTHFSNTMASSPDGEKVILELRFMRLDTMVGAYCA